MDDQLSADEMAELNAELAEEAGGAAATVPDDIAETPADELEVVHLKNPCPKCGGAVAIEERAYACACGWMVWRNILTHDITHAEIEAILRDGQSGVINDFESPKSGKEFSAILKLAPADDDAEPQGEGEEAKPKRTLELEFVDRPVTSVGACPKCKSPVVARAGNYFCEQNNRKNAAGEAVTPKCDFVLWGETSGKTLPASAVADLLAGKKTRVITGFTSRTSGKKFDAALKLAPSGKIEFVFQEKQAQAKQKKK